MKKINPEHIKAVLDFINQSPYYKLLSIETCKLDFGYSRVEVNLGNKHLNPIGVPHGGVYASIIDTAAYLAVYCTLEENVGLISLDLKVDYLAAMKEGKLIAEGKQIKAGRTVCLSEAAVADANGKLLAHGSSKLMITQSAHSLDQAGAAIGSLKLPPKFL